MRYWLGKLSVLLARFWFIPVSLVLALIFMGYAKTKGTLNAWNEDAGGSYVTYREETETERSVSTFTYQNEEIEMTMEVPQGWQKVTKDGYDTFVHAESASSIQVEVLEYYPRVNSVTQDAVAETVAEEGMELTEFSRTSATSYYDVARKYGTGGVTDRMEVVLWDRAKVLKVVAKFDDANYDRLKPELTSAFDSIVWNREDPIPDGFMTMYFQTGDFELSVPETWIGAANDDGSFYAYDEETGANVTVTVKEPTDLSSVNQLDYVDYLGVDKQGFALAGFNQLDSGVYGEATFTSDGVAAGVCQYDYSNGGWWYVVSCAFPQSTATDSYPIAQTILDSFRSFYDPSADTVEVPDVSSETETSGADGGVPSLTMDDGSSETEFNPASAVAGVSGTGAAQTETVAQGVAAQTEAPAQAQTGIVAQTNAQGSTETAGQASGLTDAFMQAAGLSEEMATYAEQVWLSVNAGDPVDVTPYAESDSVLVVQVTNSMGVPYCLYFSKTDGSLLQVKAQGENGPTVWTAG